MSMSKLCIICHQWSSPLGEDQPTSTDADGEESLTKVEEKMKIFFNLLISHLNLWEDKSEDDGGGAGVPELLKRTIEGGLLCCGECLKSVDSFVKLYRQLKAIEGRLNAKLKMLTNVMFQAQAGTWRLKQFREAVTKGLNMEEEVADKIIILKRRIVRKGRKLLREAKSPEKSEDLGGPSSKNLTGNDFEESQPPSPHRQGSEVEWLLPNSPPDVKNENEWGSEDESEASDIFLRESSPCDEPEQTVQFEKATNDPVPSSADVTDVSESDGDDPSDAKLGGDDTDCLFIIRPSSSASQAPIRIPKTSKCRDKLTKLYHCHICPKKLGNRKAFRVHYESDHMHLKFGCGKCKKEFTRREAFNRHYQHVHMGIRNFSCDKCGRRFTRKCYLDAHKPETCDGVLTKRRRPSGIRRSRKKEIAKSKEPIERPAKVRRKKQTDDNQVHREYTCRRCQQVFKSSGEHRRHVKEAHPKSEEGPEHVCEVCGKVFPTFNRLAFHISTVHCKSREFVCEICGGEFKRRDNLDDHRNGVHFGIRKPRAPRQRKRTVMMMAKSGNEDDPKPLNEGDVGGDANH